MSELLGDLSNSLAGIVDTAGQSVVRVEARRRLPASGVVWSPEGVIVTAHHVVRKEDNIRVGLADGQSAMATLVGRDPTIDLAVLHVDDGDLAPAAWSGADDLKVGHLVLALGRPGRTAQATLGIVSALGESWHTPAGGELERYLQTDVVMYPGFSGGPLVNVAGQVVGLNTSALLRGVSLAVPQGTLRKAVEMLLAHGRVRRGYLGVGIQPVRLPQDLAQQIGQESGLLLVQVKDDSPAHEGGLFLGDTIVALDSEPVRDHDALTGLLSGDRVGTEVSVRVVRAGQLQDLSILIGERA